MFSAIADPKTCKGMDPEVIPGDDLFIDRNDKTGEKGIFLVEIKGELRLCRLTKTDCGEWLVFSNMSYCSEFVTVEELNTLKLHGKLIKLVRKY